MNYEAVINYHNMRQLESDPRYIGTLSSDDLQKLLIKVGGVCVAFDRKYGFKEWSLTVDIRGAE